jgi:peptidoglycan-N-acetylmuramic acid deacetylase
MKKVFAVLLIFSLTLTLTACFHQNNGNATTASQEFTTAEIYSSTQAEITSETATTILNTEPSTVTTEPVTTAIETSAAMLPPVTTAKAPTTTPVEPSTSKFEAVTGAPDPDAKTYTGYEPLPQVKFTVLDPGNSRGLSTKAMGFVFGIGKNGAPPVESINNQKFFDRYDALALDRVSAGKVLHLTFDCGYENGYTAKILDTLKAKHVQAAFFCTLTFIKSEPALVARMIKEGHIVGNHSSTHPVFPTITRTQMALEIQNCDNYLRLNFGYSAPYFRFPEGSYSTSSLDLVQSLGYRSVFWSVAYADWDPAKQLGTKFAFDTVTSRLHPGAVILLHAVSKDNTAALGSIIDWARAQGYRFESL